MGAQLFVNIVNIANIVLFVPNVRNDLNIPYLYPPLLFLMESEWEQSVMVRSWIKLGIRGTTMKGAQSTEVPTPPRIFEAREMPKNREMKEEPTILLIIKDRVLGNPRC